MLTINECGKFLKNNKKKYTDNEIKLIREKLYQIAQLDYQLFNNKIKNS